MNRFENIRFNFSNRLVLLFFITAIIFIFNTSIIAVEIEYADMNNWEAAGPGNADWNVTNGGRNVEQTVNGDPIFYISDKNYSNIVFKSTISVSSPPDGEFVDNDFIGVVGGYKSPLNTTSNDYEMILFDWKKEEFDELYSLVDIKGNISDYNKYFWDKNYTDINGIFYKLGNPLVSSEGWIFDKKYQFEMLYTENEVKIKIDDKTIFSESGDFSQGRIGFYNYSQSYVNYGEVQIAQVASSTANQAPVAKGDSYGTDVDTKMEIDRFSGLLQNDYDPNLDNFKITVIDNTDNGTLSLYNDGSFTYTPESNFSGKDSFTYKLVETNTDESLESNTVTVNIGVISDNQAPTDISIDKDVAAADSAEGTVVCEFTTADANSSDEHDYILTNNGGGVFKVVDNQLHIADSSSLGSPGTANSIRLKSTDLLGESVEKNFNIEVGINFPDQNLKSGLIDYGVDTNDDGEITVGEAEALNSHLALYSEGISDLSGLEYFTNLISFDLRENSISDITPLQDLTNLTTLSLQRNSISDISPLANLTSLTDLSLRENNISNISPLANLTGLTDLYISYNDNISDISYLKELTNLKTLSLNETNIGNDLTSLENLVNLETLNLYAIDNLSDISPLANLTKLKTLNIPYNYSLTDISPLAGLTNLNSLDLDATPIKDIRPLLGKTISDLSVSNNDFYNSSDLNAVKVGNLKSPNDNLEVWVPAGFVTNSIGMREAELDGASIKLEVYPTTFADDSLDKANFSLLNAPVGLSIASVDYIDQNNCTVNFAFDGFDFDSDITELEINIDSEEFPNDESGSIIDEYGNSLGDIVNFSDGIPYIKADNDQERITIADDGELVIGAESGEIITVKLTGGQFVDNNEFDAEKWSVDNLPESTAVESIKRIDNNTAEITLSGNSNPNDYNGNINNFSVTVPISQYIDSSGDSDITADSGVTLLDKRAPEEYSVSFSQEYVNLSNQKSISFSLSGAEVGSIYNYSIDDQDNNTAAVTGSGEVTASDESISGIDLSSLSDGQLNLSITLTDQEGNQGEAASVSIDKDTIKVEILNISSESGNDIFGVNDNIIITFNEAVKAEAGRIAIKKASDGSLVEEIDAAGDRISGSGTETITINPAAVFKPAADYYLIIAENTFVDTAGNKFEGVFERDSLDFTTAGIPKMILEMKDSYENRDSLAPGQRITYNIEIKNIGQANLEAAEITAYIPSNTKYVEGSTKVNGTQIDDQNAMTFLTEGYKISSPSADPGIITNNENSAAVKIEYQVEIRENTALGSKIENQVELNGKCEYLANPIKTVLSDDPDTEKENDITISQIGDAALIEVEKVIEDSNGGDVEKGESLQVKNIVRNRGNKKALSVKLRDLLPENVSFKAEEIIINEDTLALEKGSAIQKLYVFMRSYFNKMMSKSKNNYTAYAQSDLPYTINNGEIIVYMGDVEAGGEVAFNYTITVSEDTPDGAIIKSTSNVSSQDTAEIEVTEEVVIGQMPNLKPEISVKDLNGGDIEVGDIVEITAALENAGNVKANDLTITSPIAEELRYLENSTKLNGQIEADSVKNRQIEIDYGYIEAGERAELKYRAEIIDSAAGVVVENIMNYSAAAKAADTGLKEDKYLHSDEPISVSFGIGAAAGSVKLAGKISSSSENIPEDWHLELYSLNTSLGKIQLGKSGEFEFSGLSDSRDYRLLLKHPETEVVYLEKVIKADNLENSSIYDQDDMFVDPAGIVYNSLTRKAVAGAVLTLVDQNGEAVPDNYLKGGQQNQVTSEDGIYQFELNFAEAQAGEYSIRVKVPNGYLQPESDAEISTIIIKEKDPLDTDDIQFEDADSGTTDIFEVVDNENNAQPPAYGEDTTYYLDFQLNQNTDKIVKNNLPIDPAEASLVEIDKSASESQVSIGEFVSYKIKIENNRGSRIEDLTVYDKLPAGFKYVENSAHIKIADGSKKLIEPEGKRLLSWKQLNLNAEESLSLIYTVVVGTGLEVNQEYLNRAYTKQGQSLISNIAEASVLVRTDPTFSSSTIIGKVFYDSNQNGIQDAGEKGIKEAVLVTNLGQEITTDEYGKYSIDIDSGSFSSTGKTLIIKLQKSSLNNSEKVISNNPAIIKVPAGIMKKVNFIVE